MSKRKKSDRADATDNLRLSPEQRLCPRFDEVSVKSFPAPSREDMGVRVLDNCAEENIK